MQHAGRVCRIADNDQVRLHRQLVRSKPEVAGWRQNEPLRRVPSRNERRLGFGELRMDDQRSMWTEGTGEQGESFGAARCRQHLINGDGVGLGDGLACCIGVGISSEVLGCVVDDCAEPGWRRGQPDVDR